MQLKYSEEETDGPVFRGLQLSLDKNKLLLRMAYQEGSGSALLDLVSKKVIELPFSGYIDGTSVIGWYGKDIFFKKYKFEEFSIPCISDDLGKEKKCFDNLNLSDNTQMALFDQTLLIRESYRTVPSGQFVCNNIDKEYEVGTNYTNLYTFDLQSEKLIKILSVDSTDSSNVPKKNEIYSATIITYNGEKKIFAQIKYNDQMKTVILDPSKENDVTVVNLPVE